MAVLTFRGQMRVNRTRLDRPSVIVSLLQTWSCKSEIKQFRWAATAADKKRFRDLINPMHESFCAAVVTPHLAQWRQYVYRLSVTLLVRARDFAAKERRRRNSLNYGDLLNLTAKVLRANAQVRRALQQKYRHLFVDEFQDTDPVQAEIVFLLAAEEERSAAKGVVAAAQRAVASDSRRKDSAEWRTVRLRPGAIFVVGDPKQSIYRFRRADVSIYRQVCELLAAAGAVPLKLTTSFRSVPAIQRVP